MKRSVLLLLVILWELSLSAGIVWPEEIPIRQGVNIEWFRTGVETHDGGAIFVWSDTKLGERDLYAQKVDASGNIVWGEPLIIDNKSGRQEDPVITRTSDNNYIIAWIDFYGDLDGDVYAQKIDTQGNLLWPVGGKPVCTISGIQLTLNMEADNAGGAFIVWMDTRNPSLDLYGQRISASGAPLWDLNGNPIATGDGDEIQNTMLPDGQGGMIIAYTHTYVGDDDVLAKRISASGIPVWDNALQLATAPGNQFGVRMAALTGGDFVFTWADQRNPDPDIYAQKINLAGQLLWGEYLIVYSDQGHTPAVPQLNPRIVKTTDNAVIIVWEDKRLDYQNSDLFTQKISAAGARLWAPDGIALCTSELIQEGQRLASDNNGGCYVVWDDLRNGNPQRDDIYAQHLSASGVSLWEANGKPVCTEMNTQNGSLVKVAGDHIFISWMDMRNGSVGLYYQCLDLSGNTLLEPNGKLVFWGLSGDAPLLNYLIVKRSNDVAIIWQDTRFANDGYRIYIQFLNPDGTIDLETDGRPITMSVGGTQMQPQAAVSPDDHLIIVWEDARGFNPKVYAQLISPSGERLWGDTGLEITDRDILGQKDVKVSYYEGAYYVGWSDADLVGTSFFYHVYGQKIVNGQKMWGPDGILISTLPQINRNNECTLYKLIENYYVWQRINPSDNSYTTWVKRVDDAGAAYAGWPEDGIKASTYSNWDTIQRFPTAHKTPEGIFVMWNDQREDSILNYWGQHISASGTRLWDPLGVNLADNQREQELPAITVNNTGISFVWCEINNGMSDIIAQKYSFAGDALWSDSGYYIVQKDSTQSTPTLVSFSNGGSFVAWTDYLGIESDIYYKYIRDNGTLVGADEGTVLCNVAKQQYDPKAATLGDMAYVVWSDARTSGKTEILGLFAQKLNNEASSANDDDNTPPLEGFYLQKNYPNPFNPNTTISFSLAKNTPALELKIFNLKGQLVKTLFSGNLDKGNHSLVWNGLDNNGASVGSGVYFYSLSDGNSSQQRKMLMMK